MAFPNPLFSLFSAFSMLTILVHLLLMLITVISSSAATNSKSPTTGRFLLITDFHVDKGYDYRHGDRSKMCHRPKMNNGEKNKNDGEQSDEELGKYGDRACDSPPALVEFMVDEAKRQIPEPEFIIWTGDTPAHVEYTEEEFLETLQSASNMMRRRFPNKLIIPVLGNHDMMPASWFPDHGASDTSKLYLGIFNVWKEWIGEEAKETFLKGGYYRLKSPLDESEFLVLNTNLYYVMNKAQSRFRHPNDPTGQFAFLERELERVKSRNGAVHILAHVPPEDLNGKPVQRMFLNPAVTPMFGLNNPAFRIFEYNKKNWDILDIKTYYVDLDELNNSSKNGDAVLAKLEYSMRAAYGLKALDANGLNEFVERMRTNQHLFEEYYRHKQVMFWDPKAIQPERSVHLCIIGNVDLKLLRECTQQSINFGDHKLKIGTEKRQNEEREY